ncbi:MAG: hypothetical protein R2865_05785 [Deinococcales bacterium]
MHYSHLAHLSKPVSRLIQGTVMINDEGISERAAFNLLDSIHA